ncbi:MAG: T9SS type A sorting domain-containing protein [Bacteroidota bacterium]
MKQQMKKSTLLLVVIGLSTHNIKLSAQTISAGGGHTLVACSQWSAQGQAMVWGNNLYGQLGNGSAVSIATLPAFANITNVERVAAGWSHCTAVKKDGTLWSWGYNASGQLGLASAAQSISQPTQVAGMTAVRTVSCGHEHTLALKQNGTVWTCGINGQGQLGNGSNNPSGTFMQVTGLSNIIQVAGGYTHSMALKNDGTVWVWGGNTVGQLGIGTYTSHNTPQQNFLLSDVVFIAAAGSHSLAIKSDGTVWSWGKNNYGQLGIGTNTNHNTPQQILSIPSAIAVAAGWEHSMVLKSDSTVWAFGRNIEGQLGIGNLVTSSTPVQCALPIGSKEISAGTYHNMATGNDNVLRMWGNNYDGHCGIGTSQNYIANPTATLSVCDLASGSSYTESLETVMLYPNPVSSKLNILNAANYHFKLFDCSGRLVASGQMEGDYSSLDVHTYAEGIYQLVLNSTSNTICRKLVVSH